MFWLILGLVVLYILGLLAPRIFNTFEDTLKTVEKERNRKLIRILFKVLWPITVVFGCIIYLLMGSILKIYLRNHMRD